MKKTHLLISLRNLAAALIIITVVLTAFEFFLAAKSEKSENYDAVEAENQNLLLMQFERTPIDKIFMSATNVENSKSLLKTAV